MSRSHMDMSGHAPGHAALSGKTENTFQNCCPKFFLIQHKPQNKAEYIVLLVNIYCSKIAVKWLKLKYVPVLAHIINMFYGKYNVL